MVLESIKTKIAQVFVAHLKQVGYGRDVEIKIGEDWDELCIVRVPTALEYLGQDFFDAITTELREMPEIEEVYDSAKNWALKGKEERRIEITVADGSWKKTESDEQADEENYRRYTDPEYAKQIEEKARLERLGHWQDYILPIPASPAKYSEELFLTMSYQPYDWIKNGEKTTEFRAYTPSYAKRLLSHPIKRVKFQRGYGGPGRPFPEQMVWEVKRIDLYDINTHTSADPFNLTPIVPTHFAIELGRRVK